MDHWIHAELNLSHEEMLRKVKVIGRTKDENGDGTASCDPNIFLYTFTYDFEFFDGEIKENSADVIAENIHSQVDEDGCNI